MFVSNLVIAVLLNSIILSGSAHQQNDATTAVNSTRALTNLLADPSSTLPLGNMNQNDVHFVDVSSK